MLAEEEVKEEDVDVDVGEVMECLDEEGVEEMHVGVATLKVADEDVVVVMVNITMMRTET